MKNITIFSLSILLLSYCSTNNEKDGHELNEDDKNEITQIYQKVLDKHDEIMPRIDEIMSAKSILEKELERIEEGVKTVSEQRRKALKEIIKELDMADNSMMEWMRNYARKPADTMSVTSAKEKLKTSQEIIEDVEKKVNSVLEKAEVLIEEIEKENSQN